MRVTRCEERGKRVEPITSYHAARHQRANRNPIFFNFRRRTSCGPGMARSPLATSRPSDWLAGRSLTVALVGSST